MFEPLLSVRDLSIRYRTRLSTVQAVDSASFDLERGKIVAIVGESGCGKTTTGLSIVKLLPQDAEYVSGSILFKGTDLVTTDEKSLRRVRGRQISLIFQDPIAGLNPVLTIGDQVAEILTSHLDLKKKEAKKQAIQVLRDVGLAEPEQVAKSYTFQLSGGMCQRVMIGIATALNPDIIIADEPTSALDVTVQAQILWQLDQLRKTRGTAILLITHDFGVVSNLADEVLVMYGGRIVEAGDVSVTLREPLHPYSHALMATLPRMDERRPTLAAIPGHPPELSEPAEHCPFLPRCQKALSVCRESPAPPLVPMEGAEDRAVACYNPIWQG
jgi:oligopeptide/dipeptide ABC transporter ATP-binding protein